MHADRNRAGATAPMSSRTRGESHSDLRDVPHFRAIVGYGPYPWQRRFYAALARGTVPDAVDIPTGLGKTACVLLALLARLERPELPRRIARGLVAALGPEAAERVAVLTGTLRGHERAMLTDGAVWRRFTPGERHPPDSPSVYLVSTAAGEVGVTRKYAEAYCRISSYLQSMANQGYNPLVAIQIALAGRAARYSRNRSRTNASGSPFGQQMRPSR